MTAAAALAGCGSRSTSTPTPTATVPQNCSHAAPVTVAPENWSLTRRRLAPMGASAVRLCLYSGLGARPPLTLVTSKLLVQPAQVEDLTAEFDRLPLLPRAVFCPNDDRSQILALLAYTGHSDVTISVGLTGCNIVTNGRTVRTAGGPAFLHTGASLVGQLDRLVD